MEKTLPIETARRSLGIEFLEGGIASINIWAPNAKRVWLALAHAEDIQLTGGEQGYWTAVTGLVSPGDRYKIRLETEQGQQLLADPASLCQPNGVHGPSQALATRNYAWQDQNWKGKALEDYIIYEVHVGTFTPEGTFHALEQRLPYLADLGITAIELMPVASFPGQHNWGYDGVFPYAVQYNYGGAAGLQHLVDACHQAGISVILDVVYNHLGPEGNILPQFAPYFTDRYQTPWGQAINFDGEYSDGVRRYFIENALMWFRDFHIDALRLDAVHAIRDFGAKHFLASLSDHVAVLGQQLGRKLHLIAESDLNDTRVISPVAKGGYGLDAQWIDEFHHALRVAAGEARKGYYSDFDGVKHLAKAYQSAYVYDGMYSPHRLRTFGNSASGRPGQQFVVFAQNHDQVGNRMLGERTSMLYGLEKLKLLAGAVLVSPYVPLFFMGEEWGASSPFLYFVDHADAELAEAVRQGRREEFKSQHADGQAPDPTKLQTFQASVLDWNEKENGKHAVLLTYYKALIALRKTNPILASLSRKGLKAHADEAKQCVVLQRQEETEQLWAVLNFSDRPQTLLLNNTKPLKTLISSASSQWGGPENTESITLLPQENFTAPPESITLFNYADVQSPKHLPNTV